MNITEKVNNRNDYTQIKRKIAYKVRSLSFNPNLIKFEFYCKSMDHDGDIGDVLWMLVTE